MGIQLEMISGRTLAFKGEKRVETVCQNKNATTHSLTVQPLLNASGKLCLPVLTCFYEPAGAPQCFQRDLSPYKNLKCVWTTSGKMNKEIMKNWMKEDFISTADKNSVLFLDSWSGFNEAKLIPEVKANMIHILTIPKKTTGKIQPCDIGFNRYFKSLYRTTEDKIRRLHPEFMLTKRSNVGLLLNQTVEQFCAPRYSSLIAHSFIKAGFFNHDYEEYQTPDDYCYHFKKVGARCDLKRCGKLAFIKCSWCEKFFCFDDYFVKIHCCRNNNVR
uniref:DDE-1 domain-containing protein n=1 Tax=Panagrolaimus sp. PS1159 TaxID=55785 RepID=A0AC35GHL9_9BILA